MKFPQIKPANIEVNDEEEEDDINCDIESLGGRLS